MPRLRAPSDARTQGALGLDSPGATEDAAARRVISAGAPPCVAGRATKPLSHHFDASISSCAFEAEDLLQRPDRYLDLVERRLARRQSLQPQARGEHRHQHAVAGVLAGEADQLVRQI